MRPPSPMRLPRTPAARSGFTLIESALSILLVGVTLVAAMHCVGAARTSAVTLTERARALALARNLLAEILQQAYADPEAGPASTGIEDNEKGATRALFDDADDYDGWTASPPQYKNGDVVPASDGYEQLAAVVWVPPHNLQQTSLTPTGVKRITVTLRRQGRELITLTAFRTVMWLDPAEIQGGSP